MEEKERYVIRYDLDYNQCLIDTEENQGVGDYIKIVKLLNQQDKELSKLRASYQQVKEENHQLKQQLAESERKLEEYKKCNCKECMTDYEKNLNQIIDKYLNENIKLKQQLHDLPKKIVEEIRTEIEFPLYVHPDFDEFECLFDIDKLLYTILKKYGGEDE